MTRTENPLAVMCLYSQKGTSNMKDWKNRMSEVALMFGVQIGEEFNVFLAGEKKPRRCKFTRQGVYQWLSDWQKWEFDHDLDVLYGLLVGEACIKADTDTTPPC